MKCYYCNNKLSLSVKAQSYSGRVIECLKCDKKNLVILKKYRLAAIDMLILLFPILIIIIQAFGKIVESFNLPAFAYGFMYGAIGAGVFILLVKWNNWNISLSKMDQSISREINYNE